MNYKLIDVAYGGLLHDIGKFYQRIYTTSNLTEEEKQLTPIHELGYHTHLHSGYTSRFIQKYLNMNDAFEKMTSEHHKNDLDDFINIIKKADHIASAIDRQDEMFDNDEHIKKRKAYITSRLYSVLGEVEFKGKGEDKVFPLSTLYNMNTPISHFQEKNVEESAQEYKQLFNQFVEEVDKNLFLKKRRDYISYNYMYNLINKYLVTIPASTYNTNKSAVSLFDHLKITSAIASCLIEEECYKNEKFIMLEIDVSGIQKFIYQVAEGETNKPGLAKALRGRSSLVGLITNAISYAFLNEFGLTVSNILFNTGGGSMILLPYTSSTIDRVDKVSKYVRKELFKMFQTDITFVYSTIELNAKQLEEFQSEKAIELKSSLGRNKMQKFSDMIDDDFFFEKVEINKTCNMCGRVSEKDKCDICLDIEKVSDIYTKHKKFGIIYDYDKNVDIENIGRIDLKFVELIFIEDASKIIDQSKVWYVDAINEFEFGNRKLISNLIPLTNNKDALNFQQIIQLTPKKYGDSKLAILKMDVDNLGGIFAFGLKYTNELRTQRSISKYVTMSRLMEFFFGHEIKNICKDITKEICPDIDNETMFYINYAGGDDLVIIGSAYSITKLALEIHKRFSNFTGNKNITISGGIHFQGDKKPIRFGVQEAENQLELSKVGNKNAISMIDTRVPFDEYEELLNHVYKLCDYIREGKISRTMLYNIMSFIRDKSYTEFVYLVPRIQYTLFRNIDKKYEDVLNEMKKEISEIINDEKVKKFVLKLKLTMLFTRDN